ncbi:redoxin domain-containing protein [Thalassoroseus pseudoceratinae]|uniref:redoxin domain-containing protein n=1 Tax=Thalassoroseus pseudoceratinae TaxID=2713176 RepID=UPI001422816C|nr:redoxin domain-containing protein [Thalassoroseus pseudoceratinae]
MSTRTIGLGTLAFLAALGACFAPRLYAAEKDNSARQSRIGRQVEPWVLSDFRGKDHALKDFDEKFLVVAFIGTECPLAKLYAPRLVELEKEYADRGVGFLAINPNTQDSLTEIAAHARKHQLSFPVLKDVGNRVADQMGAIRTPEVFVLDSDRRIRYVGRIDDQYDIGVAHEKPRHRFLANALDDLLADQEVATAEVETVGCFIGRIQSPKADAKVTWSNQISRIFQKRCVECHRKGEIAPFALTEYEEVVGWADMILEVVGDRRMPPWHANPKYGHFLNDRSMTKTEEDLIFQWVQDGAPEGDPSQLPEPISDPVAGWQLPQKPDLVIPMDDKPFAVPASGEVKYKYFRVDPEFTEDKWIRMAEVVPGNRAVVHHVLVLVRPPREARSNPIAQSEWLVGYVPGLRAKPYPDGMAKLIPAGSEFIFQVHYTPNGSPQEDLSRVGLVFADPEDVTHAIVTTKAAYKNLDIPPHADNHRVEAKSKSVPIDVQLLGFMPHMHLRGKSFSYEAIYPDGQTEILLDVPEYDFNWQTAYRIEKPPTLPAGTKMHCVAHFDNSDKNLANPDPTKNVGWGDQTWEEMMIGYFDVAIAVDAKTLKVKSDAPKFGALLKELVRRIDSNENGVIDRSEVKKEHVLLFNRFDKNKDDKLSPDELLLLGRFLQNRE